MNINPNIIPNTGNDPDACDAFDIFVSLF